jgi:hypothetical protein
MPTQVKGACRRCWCEKQPTAGMGGALFGSGGLRGDLANGAGWVGDQPRHRRMGHPTSRPEAPPAPFPLFHTDRGSAAFGSILMTTSLTSYAIRVDDHLDDHWAA